VSAAAPFVDPRVLALVEEAAAWRLLGRLFECPSAEWRTDLEALSREVGDEALSRAVGLAATEATEGQYHSVFGPGGPAPPREVSYRDSIELGSVMSSLFAYYDAFGYRPALGESPDHVAVEIGFLAFLRLKEAFAIADEDGERAAITADAAESFRSEHLSLVSGRLAEQLAGAHLEYLRTASQVLAARVGPRPGPKRLTVLQDPIEAEGSDFSCGDR
jgi:hypothetical protein